MHIYKQHVLAVDLEVDQMEQLYNRYVQILGKFF